MNQGFASGVGEHAPHSARLYGHFSPKTLRAVTMSGLLPLLPRALQQAGPGQMAVLGPKEPVHDWQLLGELQPVSRFVP
jgi:hypothetical protein